LFIQIKYDDDDDDDESILAFICLMENETLALVRDFSIYYYFVVASLTEV